MVTFYAQFRTKPLGKNVINICNGTACHVNGAKMVYDIIQDELDITYDETSDDGNFSLLSVACIGCCSLAPVITINARRTAASTPPNFAKIIREFKMRVRKAAQKETAGGVRMKTSHCRSRYLRHFRRRRKSVSRLSG